MHALANSPFAAERSRRDGVLLAAILAAHVLFVVALNQGLTGGMGIGFRVPEPPPIAVIEEPPLPREQTPQLPGPVETVPVPRPLDVDLPVDSRVPTLAVVDDDALPPDGPGTGVLTVPAPVRIGPRPDAGLVGNGRWSPPMPASVKREARRAGDLGATVIRCVVGLDGRCARVELLTASGNARLDQSALRHAERVWRFTPGTVDGEPVEASYDLRITWRVVD